jgi:pheromone shutdown protein TraB
MLAELGRAVPQIKGPLIDERDQYLASMTVDAGKGRQKVVAVVGAAHVPGMKEHFGKPVDRAALDQIPPPSLVWRLVKWLVPILFLVGIVWFWRQSEDRSLTEMMLAWILPTSIGAAGLTLLAGGSIFSVVAAFVVAPIAAIHPLLATAMVVGVVEAWRRKPGVADCEQLPELHTFRDYWNNQVTRILLIAVASGLGTAGGFWIGVSMVAKQL